MVANLSELQKLLKPMVVKHSFNLNQLVETLRDWSANHSSRLITTHGDNILVAGDGQVSSTPAKGQTDLVELSAYTGVWRLQQPQKPFEAITTAVYEYINRSSSGGAGRS